MAFLGRKARACETALEQKQRLQYPHGRFLCKGNTMGNRLYIGNLPYSIDEAGLRSFLGDGIDGCQVLQVRIVTDRESGRPRGFAFAELGGQAQAAAAIQRLNGQELGGRTIVVNEAKEPPNRSAARGERGRVGGSRGGSPDSREE